MPPIVFCSVTVDQLIQDGLELPPCPVCGSPGVLAPFTHDFYLCDHWVTLTFGELTDHPYTHVVNVLEGQINREVEKHFFLED